MVLAKDIFRDFREHSVSEFFRKNAAMLGYTGKMRSLTTVVHEGVTNSLDAAEESGILPRILVTITSVDDDPNHYKVVVEDNASGIPPEYVPRVFGKMLAGTKLHRNVQSRGQQGIGVSGATMFAQVTSGNPTKVTTSTEDGEIISQEVMIDVDENVGKIKSRKSWKGKWRGTRVEFDVKDVVYQRSRYGPHNYLRMSAISNPHAQIVFTEPDGSVTVFRRTDDEVPDRPERIPPHPSGVGPDDLLELAKRTNSKSIGTLLVSELSRFSRRKLKELRGLVDFDLDEPPSKLNWESAEEIVAAFKKMKFMVPPTKGLRSIGKERIESGLQQILNPEFAFAVTRSPEIYRGGIPFIVETGIAYGGNAGARSNSGHRSLELIRFANRAPLIFDQGACAMTAATRDIDWGRYGVDPERAPLTLFINLVSVHVPYTSAGKQSVAEESEIYEEVRQAIMAAARKLRSFLHRKKKRRERERRAGLFERYLPIISQRAADLAGKKPLDVGPLLKKITGVDSAKKKKEEG